MDLHIVIPITETTDWDACDREAKAAAESHARIDGFDILGEIERKGVNVQHFTVGPDGKTLTFDCLEYVVHTTRAAPYGGPALVPTPA